MGNISHLPVSFERIRLFEKNLTRCSFLATRLLNELRCWQSSGGSDRRYSCTSDKLTIMKKRITNYIAAAMLLTALAGAAWIVSEVFTTQPVMVSKTAVDMDQTLTVLP
jgi:hypothetical protein